MIDINNIKIDDIPTTAEEMKAYEEKFGKNEPEPKSEIKRPSEEEIRAGMDAQKQAFLDKTPSDEEMKEMVIEELKKIYDPELPVNIYDLGLIYNVECWTNEVSLMKWCKVTMTLTSATCSMSEVIVDLVKSISKRLEYLENVDVDIVFDPPWDQSKMSDEAKLAMGML
ncbi:metal-sulfur cluster assembly factor [Sulfurovum riftiae]|uniref:metal-sulfur cluster assembly factor n=1 Tax=Sulfurovum riftiae TaxID=1630136 RepID=UPI0008310DCB|nr:iron-sulfur cluster assembly protein [Sulfurovum riftiae]